MTRTLWNTLPALALAAGPVMAQDMDGEAIFAETCAGCHAEQSGLPTDALAEMDEAAFAEALAQHPPVGGVGELTEDQIAALHAYFAARGDG